MCVGLLTFAHVLVPGASRNEDSDSEPEDNVRLWEDGWKERYYLNKFGVPCDDDEFVAKVVSGFHKLIVLPPIINPFSPLGPFPPLPSPPLPSPPLP